MPTGTIEGVSMAAKKTSPVRLTDEAMEWARIASGYTGESMAEYVSRIVAERARQDADRLHAEKMGPRGGPALPGAEKEKPAPKGPKGAGRG
jgi:hypothetical protein